MSGPVHKVEAEGCLWLFLLVVALAAIGSCTAANRIADHFEDAHHPITERTGA